MARRFERVRCRQTREHRKEARRNFSKNGCNVDRSERTERGEGQCNCRCQTLSSFIWRPTKRDPRDQAARGGIDPSMRHTNCRVVVMTKDGIYACEKKWITGKSDQRGDEWRFSFVRINMLLEQIGCELSVHSTIVR